MEEDLSYQEIVNPFNQNLPEVVLIVGEDGSPSLGKGINSESRFLSAYGEHLERSVMNSITSDIEVLFDDSNTDYLNPRNFFIEENVDEKEVEWKQVSNSESSNIFFAHRPIRKSSKAKYYSHTSNGCAVGISKEDAVRRAEGEVLERHNFLSAWYFQDRLIRPVQRKSTELEDIIRLSGWRIEHYIINSKYNEGTACSLLINESDERFTKGGAVLGLSFGAENEISSSLCECIQALEAYSLGGGNDECLDYYLKSPEGGEILSSFLKREKGPLDELPPGVTYHFTCATGGEIPFYAEAFIPNTIPIQLGLKIENPRVPKERMNSFVIENTQHPIPLG
ncbi:MAG: YcaO-like family protein [Bacteriovoracaceae bacterium]|nr:YcaO-like family protein [Bacteriovoracaceae bacterium]